MKLCVSSVKLCFITPQLRTPHFRHSELPIVLSQALITDINLHLREIGFGEVLYHLKHALVGVDEWRLELLLIGRGDLCFQEIAFAVGAYRIMGASPQTPAMLIRL